MLDLDRPTAQALADARVAAVVDASDLISGRYPNLGPEVLAEAGVVLVDGVGADGLAAIKDGTSVRVHEGSVYVGEQAVASGRVLDRASIETALGAARQGMISQLQSFTHNSSEFLRREQDLLLHGTGLPTLRTAMAGRPVVVVSDPRELAARRKDLKPFLREQRPVLVGVDAGADALLGGRSPAARRGGHRERGAAEREGRPRRPRTSSWSPSPAAPGRPWRPLERLGVRPHRLETTAAAEDAALLLADAAEARVIVVVGSRATLEEFLDRGRTGLASTYLTRLKVGTRIVDAEAVPTLYSGRVRPRHVLLALLVCVIAVAAAIATTPVGQEWAQDAWTWLGDAFADLRGTLLVIRRLLVTFVAIVMAMAAGIALGGGPLSDIGRTPSQAAAPPAQPAADPQDEARAAYADAFAAGVAPGLYAGRLHGHPVAIAHAARRRRRGRRGAHRRGPGGRHPGHRAPTALRRALVDPGEKTLVDTLGPPARRAARERTS